MPVNGVVSHLYQVVVNKISPNAAPRVAVQSLDVTLNFKNALNAADRLAMLKEALDKAFFAYVPSQFPVLNIRVMVQDTGRDVSTSDVLSATLSYFNDATLSSAQRMHLDLRSLGDFGLRSDLGLLNELMEKGVVEKVQVQSVSCKKSPAITCSKDKMGGMQLVLAPKPKSVQKARV